MGFDMQYLSLVFFFAIVIFVAKGILSFLLENILPVAGIVIFIVCLILINSYIENKRAIQLGKEKDPDNADLMTNAGYRFNIEKERWEQKLNNSVVAYIGSIKYAHRFKAGFLYDRYDMPAEESFSTILDAKEWVDTFYTVFTEGKINSYLNNVKPNSIITIRVNNDSSSKEESFPKPTLSSMDTIVDTTHKQNKVSGNDKYNNEISLAPPVFTDITVGGNTDDFNRQNDTYWNSEGETAVDDNFFTTNELSSLKKQPLKTADPLRRPYIVFSEQGKSFYSDMKKYENKTEKRASFSDFTVYYPTYDDMMPSDKKWYFYWRNKVRNKSYPKTDLSYIFLYVYELLCDVGVRDDSDGLNKLMAVWSNYRQEFPKLDNYLSEWIFDYCYLHNLPYGPLPFDDISVSNTDVLNKLIDRHDHEHPLKLPLYLIIGLSDYKIAKSRFYQSHEQLMKSAIPKIIALTDMYFWRKERKGLFEKFGPATETAFTRKIYPSTLFTHMQQKYNCKDYERAKELRDVITGVIKFSENVLRSIEGVSGRVKNTEAILKYTELQSIIEKYLYTTYGKKQPEANPGTTVPTNLIHKPAPVESSSELDFDKIEKLRKESDNVREILEVQEEEVEKVLLTDIAGIQLVLANISEQSKSLIYSLRTKGWEDRYDPSMKLMVDEINRIALKYLSQDLLIVDSDSNVTIEEDFRDEIDYIWQSNNTDTATAADVTNQVNTGNNPNDREPAKGTMFNYSGLPEELTDCLKSFTSTQEAALVAVLKEERPYEVITALADEAMTMPEVIIDEINEISDSYLSELLIEQDEENLSVIEPYQGMLKKALEMEV